MNVFNLKTINNGIHEAKATLAKWENLRSAVQEVCKHKRADDQIVPGPGELYRCVHCDKLVKWEELEEPR